MSFGFSIGDFLVLSKLAWDVYSSCKDSSREFKDLAGQVNSLCFILQSTAEHLLNQPPETREAAELVSLKNRCQDSLDEINCLLRKHSGLGTQKPRRWDMIKWAFVDALHFKDKLVYHATVLAALNSSLTQFSQARVEKSLDVLIRKIGRENPGLGYRVECHSGNLPSLPTARGGVPDPQDDKASDFMDDTLTSNSDCPSSDGGGGGGGGGRGLPATTHSTGQSPVIREGGHPVSSSSSSSTASGEGGAEQGHVYRRVRAEDNSVQINGDMLSTLSLSRTPNNCYTDVTASGKSWQINGNLDLEPFLELVKVR